MKGNDKKGSMVDCRMRRMISDHIALYQAGRNSVWSILY